MELDQLLMPLRIPCRELTYPTKREKEPTHRLVVSRRVCTLLWHHFKYISKVPTEGYQQIHDQIVDPSDKKMWFSEGKQT